jgi:hypothetical protein
MLIIDCYKNFRGRNHPGQHGHLDRRLHLRGTATPNTIDYLRRFLFAGEDDRWLSAGEARPALFYGRILHARKNTLPQIGLSPTSLSKAKTSRHWPSSLIPEIRSEALFVQLHFLA